MIRNADEARDFIQETESILSDSQQIGTFTNVLKEKWGGITDFNSFKNFFNNYLKDCPNPEIVNGVNVEKDAVTLWNKIDINKNGTLDSEEENLVIIEIMRHSLGLVRAHFKIE